MNNIILGMENNYMKKQIIKISNLALVLMIGLLLLTGCGKDGAKIETEKLTKEQYGYKLTVKVPKEKGYKFVEKLEETNKYAMDYPAYILDGDKVQIYFKNTSFVYQTSIILQKEHPEMDKENPNFDDFIKYNTKGYTQKDVIDLNGTRAIKVDSEYGPADNTKVVGYTYFIEKKNDKGYIYMMVLPKNEKDDIKALMKDPEVKVIVDSISIALEK